MIKRVFLGMTLLAAAGLVNACSSGSAGGDKASPDAGKKQTGNQPVTLKLYTYQNFTNDELFNDYIGEAVKKKYPYITVEWIRSQSGGMTMPDLLASGVTPDLINGWNAYRRDSG